MPETSVEGNLVWDEEKGELYILGQRQTAINAQTLCDHLDTWLASVVAETMMDDLEFRLGQEDVSRVRQQMPKATVGEILEFLCQEQILSGIGIPEVRLSDNDGTPILIEIFNPCVKGVSGAAKSFLFSWWRGALTTLLGIEMQVIDVSFNEDKNMAACHVLPRR
jgi:hypothetical protein